MALGRFRLDRRLSLLDRKSEPKHGAATGTLFNPNPSAMGLDDSAADGQAEAHPPLTGRTGPIELIEDALFIAGWNPGPSISDLKSQFVISARCRQLDGRGRRGKFQGILKQVDQHLFHQYTVQEHERQVWREIGAYLMSVQPTLQTSQCRSYDLFERVPFFLQLDCA